MSGIKVTPSVFVVALEKNKVLLIKRKNTGWLDGWYDLPAGHLEDQEGLKEAAARELKEETGLNVAPSDLALTHLHQNHHQKDNPHYGYIFLAKKWVGKPTLAEPEKADEVAWFSLDNLPDKISPYAKEALSHLDEEQVSISYHAPGSIPN